LLSQYDANFRISTKPKKDKVLIERLHKKIDEILENPEHYPVKKYELKGKRGVHVGSFVIVFEIKDEEAIFLRFKHHDHVYS
jgi:mRNA-degrading endonuclease RelE of RelBE toxin-antitoxin system